MTRSTYTYICIHIHVRVYVQPVEPHFTRPFVSVSADKSAIYAAFLLFNGQVPTAAEIEPIHSDDDDGRAERKLVSRDHQSVTEILAALQRPRLTDLQPIELTSSSALLRPLVLLSSSGTRYAIQRSLNVIARSQRVPSFHASSEMSRLDFRDADVLNAANASEKLGRRRGANWRGCQMRAAV